MINNNNYSTLSICSRESTSSEIVVVGELELLDDMNNNTVISSYPVHLGRNYIGRDSSRCNICIDNSMNTINEVHAIINIPQLPTSAIQDISKLTSPYLTENNNLINEDDITIEDLNSINKTHLSVVPRSTKHILTHEPSFRLKSFKPVRLQHGMYIHFSVYQFRFYLKDYRNNKLKTKQHICSHQLQLGEENIPQMKEIELLATAASTSARALIPTKSENKFPLQSDVMPQVHNRCSTNNHNIEHFFYAAKGEERARRKLELSTDSQSNSEDITFIKSCTDDICTNGNYSNRSANENDTNINTKCLLIPSQTIYYDSSYYGVCPHGVGVADSCNCCLNPIIPKTSLQKHMRNHSLHLKCSQQVLARATNNNAAASTTTKCARFWLHNC
jgi:hypothetical protein